MTGFRPIEGDKTRLRRLRAADLAAFQAYRSDLEVARYQSWEDMDDPRARRFLSAVETAPIPSPGNWSQIAIADAATDALIGDIGLHLSTDQREAEIGFTLAPAAQGKGMAAEALRLVSLWIFTAAPLERLIGITDARNAPSIRLIEGAGMIRVAEEEAMFKGEMCTEYTYETRRPL